MWGYNVFNGIRTHMSTKFERNLIFSCMITLKKIRIIRSWPYLWSYLFFLLVLRQQGPHPFLNALRNLWMTPYMRTKNIMRMWKIKVFLGGLDVNSILKLLNKGGTFYRLRDCKVVEWYGSRFCKWNCYCKIGWFLWKGSRGVHILESWKLDLSTYIFVRALASEVFDESYWYLGVTQNINVLWDFVDNLATAPESIVGHGTRDTNNWGRYILVEK